MQILKKCSHVFPCHRAQLLYTIQHRTVLTIFPPNLQIITTAQIFSFEGKGSAL